ncbi:MAG TPA: ABC transporter substrate-binding protein [Candidatus Dormibacteraeota bacterium]
MTHRRSPLIALAIAALTFAACGGETSNPPATQAKGNITVAGFNFSESSILASIYGKALAAKGYNVSYKLNLGNREIVQPALFSGQIDLYPGYAATELEFINKNKGEAGSDAQANVDKLNGYLKPQGAEALTPSAANDENAFAVTQATASKDKLTKLSDLSPYASQMTLGGPPECPTRPYCQPGLEKTYGLKFKAFKSLDAGGPLTKNALSNGDIDIGLVFSSDGGIAAKNLTVLQDDKHLEAADNIVPVIRTKVANAEVTALLNKIDAALTQSDLVAMNKSADVDKQDPDALAQNWVKQHGFA